MLAPTLPDLSKLDREALQALLRRHQERIATQQQLLSRESEIEHLKLLLAKLRRMQFGRKSEKLERQIEQLELRLEDLEQAQASREHQQPRASFLLRPLRPATTAKPSAASAARTSAAQHADASAESNGLARTAAESYASWAKMFRRCWSTCRHASR